MFGIRSKRSAGVPITAAVHRILVRGNAARDRQDWSQAAASFRQAVTVAPGLAHIWVQLGNMLKEQGLPAEAEAAYLQAIRLRPADAEPLLQLGHLFSLAADHAKAGQYYLRAFQADPRLIDAATALQRMMARARGSKRRQLMEALKAAMAEGAETSPDAIAQATGKTDPAQGQPSLVFDVSDLVDYFAHGRSPTGIQRVQIQIVTHALLIDDVRISICCLIEGRDDWVQIPAEAFRHVVALSLKGSNRKDPEWIAALHQLHLQLALCDPFDFPQAAYLVNLGASWQLHNYFLFVREAKLRHGIRYVPFVHDLIAILAPQHFTKSARREFVPWLCSVFSHADHVLVNSEATRRDLLQTGEPLGWRPDPANVAVIRLDADFRTAQLGPPVEPLPDSALARWQLEDEPFVLLVATVEPRKGHITAFDAWAELMMRHEHGKVPKLVCAGKQGWLSDAVYRRLSEDAALAARVTMLSGVSDAELSLLYRTCRFTIFPSLYEGWGLPITESLCHAKPVIASATSSLPEAGGVFAVYVEPGSALALADAVERMAFDAPYREAIASRIRAEFEPRSWGDVARQVATELVRMAAASQAETTRVPVSMVRLGAYHSIARSMALRLSPGMGVGETFRAGTGWSAPDAAGSWTRPGGGVLAIGLPPRDVPLRVGLLLLGAPECGLDWSLRVKLGPALAGLLERRGRKWVTFTYPVTQDDDVLRLRIESEPSEGEEDSSESGGDSTVGLAGFFVHRQDDLDAGERLLEAISLGNLDDISAYREAMVTPSRPGLEDWT